MISLTVVTFVGANGLNRNGDTAGVHAFDPGSNRGCQVILFPSRFFSILLLFPSLFHNVGPFRRAKRRYVRNVFLCTLRSYVTRKYLYV